MAFVERYHGNRILIQFPLSSEYGKLAQDYVGSLDSIAESDRKPAAPCLSAAAVMTRNVSLIKVLIVDDHHLVRTSLARLLENEEDIEVLGEAASGEEAVTLCRTLEPDVILMDLRMPGIGGLEATHKIMRNNEDVRILALTGFMEDNFAQRMLEAGAGGFISKDTQVEDMVEAIRSVFAGHRYISPDIAQRLVLSRFDSEENPFDKLSQRELQVAMMIVNCQRVSEISDRLFLSPKTVNTYRYRIFEKLGVETDVELTHLGLKHGLVEGFDTTPSN